MFEFIKEFIQFDDSIHAVFKDQSALIYSNAGTLSYFNSKGERSRIKVENCRKYDNIQEKVKEVLQVASKYTYLNSDQIIYEEAVKMKKIQTIIWPLEYQIENDYAILKSIDGYALMKLNLQTFQISLQYYSCNQTVAVVKEIENETNFVNNFIKKYNLGGTKSTAASIDCGIGYTYRILNKEYSLINFPIQWIAPFFVLVKDFLNNEKLQYLDIQFPTELIEYILNEQEEMQDYFYETYNCYKIKDQLVTKILIDQPIKTIQVNDNVSPIMNKISQINLGRPIFMFTNQAQFWFQVDGGIGLINEQLLLRDGIFWEYGQQKWEQSIYNDKYNLSAFDVYCKLINTKYKSNMNLIITQLQEKQKPVEYYRVEQGNFEELRKVDLREVGEFLLLKNGTVKAKFVDRTVITFKYPPPCTIKIISQFGLINNVEFCPVQDDRLCITYNHYLEYFQPELLVYMQYCLKLAEESYIIPEIFQQRESHSTQLSSWIEQEMEKNQRFLVYSGKYSCQEVNEPQEEQSLDERIQLLLTANQEMLQKLKK
ncbi:unnamed protein product (macronuclear) [Paramecium tetraurelia]|uniref:Uncharacterized protein n=1 Tax=Paramecium tetraurelia TaxID=5888 RepID=A0DC37_PARTE|nr:uncharacterized protein GSPATT00015481001 [Paramecium tetraurelia]CAK80604.1 unnamed protein product [Paramecium tetraurelia]|eukprot:XP_001448001.1 hypothetical protein (macronuclear) [Paramecium tetraurelia strain d4-2]